MDVPQLHNVVIRRLSVDGSISFEALPPEEFLIDRRAKSVDDCNIVAHRRYLTVSELTSMGYDYEDMLELAGDEDEFGTNSEYMSRNPVGNYADSTNGGEANRKVLYIEAYAKVDFGGSGIASLRRFCWLSRTAFLERTKCSRPYNGCSTREIQHFTEYVRFSQ